MVSVLHHKVNDYLNSLNEYLCLGMSNRKVHFSEPIHHIEYLDKQWDEIASQCARNGSDWLRMGADRQRFKDRIERTAEILNRILDFELRDKIYRERFENFVSPKIEIQSTTTAARTTNQIDNDESRVDKTDLKTIGIKNKNTISNTNQIESNQIPDNPAFENKVIYINSRKARKLRKRHKNKCRRDRRSRN